MVGKVGSGKTSLLMAICGQLDKHENSSVFVHEFKERGVALLTQEPWIQNTTIR